MIRYDDPILDSYIGLLFISIPRCVGLILAAHDTTNLDVKGDCYASPVTVSAADLFISATNTNPHPQAPHGGLLTLGLNVLLVIHALMLCPQERGDSTALSKPTITRPSAR